MIRFDRIFKPFTLPRAACLRKPVVLVLYDNGHSLPIASRKFRVIPRSLFVPLFLRIRRLGNVHQNGVVAQRNALRTRVVEHGEILLFFPTVNVVADAKLRLLEILRVYVYLKLYRLNLDIAGKLAARARVSFSPKPERTDVYERHIRIAVVTFGERLYEAFEMFEVNRIEIVWLPTRAVGVGSAADGKLHAFAALVL